MSRSPCFWEGVAARILPSLRVVEFKRGGRNQPVPELQLFARIRVQMYRRFG
jgi:hypothetical protein